MIEIEGHEKQDSTIFQNVMRKGELRLVMTNQPEFCYLTFY